MQPANLPSRTLARFAKLAVLAAFGLIFLGGMVTSLDAGLSVPDWPSTQGYNMFAFPISRWVGPVFWEHTHRLAASLAGLLTAFLTLWIWRADRRRWVRMLSLGALALVIVQGVLGGLRVILGVRELPVQNGPAIAFAIAHGCAAQAFLCVLTLLALSLSTEWERPAIQPMPALGRRWRAWAWLLVAAIFVQLILGAVMRHLHAGLAIWTFPLTPEGTLMPKNHNMFVDLAFGHRAWAMAVSLLMIFVVARVIACGREEKRLLRPALVLFWLVMLQIYLGAEVIWQRRAPIPTTLHVANGAAVLVAAFVLAVRGSRFAQLAARSPERPSTKSISA